MTLKVFLGAAAKPMLHIHRSMLEVMAHMEMPSSPRILDEIINGRLFTVYARVTQSRLNGGKTAPAGSLRQRGAFYGRSRVGSTQWQSQSHCISTANWA
jgi:hypothetical protein